MQGPVLATPDTCLWQAMHPLRDGIVVPLRQRGGLGLRSGLESGSGSGLGLRLGSGRAQAWHRHWQGTVRPGREQAGHRQVTGRAHNSESTGEATPLIDLRGR